MSREDALRKLSIRLSHLAEDADPQLTPLLDKLRQALRQGADEGVFNKIGDALARHMMANEGEKPSETKASASLGTAAAEFSQSIKSLKVTKSYRGQLAKLADSLVDSSDLNSQVTVLKDIFKLLRSATTETSSGKADGGRGWFGKKNNQPDDNLQPFLDKTSELLGRILTHIDLFNGDTKDTKQLSTQLESCQSFETIDDILDDVLELLSSLGDKVNKERITAQTFLGDLRDQLHSVEEAIFSVISDGDGSLERAVTLERQVSDDVQVMGEAVAEGDLDSLKRKVEKGLENLSSKVANYIEEEKDHNERSKTKIKNLTRKIREMESEATNLRGEIKTKQDLAVKDPLTGVYNRAGYEERITEEFARRSRVKTPLSIVFVDCNKFKEINDSFGHTAGDIVLVKVAEILKKRARTSDIICRYGGDEFVLLLPDTELEGAKIFAESACKKVLEAGFNNNGQPLEVSISCGVTEVSEEDTPASALDRADEAMYKAKKETGIKVVVV